MVLADVGLSFCTISLHVHSKYIEIVVQNMMVVKLDKSRNKIEKEVKNKTSLLRKKSLINT